MIATVSFGNLQYTYDGSAKPVTTATTPNGLMVSITYSGLTTAPANAGSYTVVGTINNINYQGSATDTLVIQKVIPRLSWSTPADITSGQALGAVQFTAVANVPGMFAYTPGAGTVLNAGMKQILSALFTPVDAINYAVASTSVMINVLPKIPLTFATPATATPPNGNVGDLIHFSASTVETNTSISWNFGDGSSADTSFIDHVFTTPGVFRVTATATRGIITGTSVTTVGISQLGSGQASGNMKIQKLAIALEFAAPQSPLDSIAIQGTLAINSGFIPIGSRLVLRAGGILREFDLDTVGNGQSGADKIMLALKRKSGIVVAQNAKFSIQLTGNFKAPLDAIGLANASNKKALSLPIELDISLDGKFYTLFRKVKYTSILNVSGTAK